MVEMEIKIDDSLNIDKFFRHLLYAHKPFFFFFFFIMHDTSANFVDARVYNEYC